MAPQIVYSMTDVRSDHDGTIKVSPNSMGSTPKLAVKIGHTNTLMNKKISIIDTNEESVG